MKATVVLTTAGSAGEASRIAEVLVEEKLAACVNVVGPIKSVFRWRRKTEKQREWLLFIKTRAGCVPRITRRIKEIHSYDLPEVIALPVVGGLDPYLRWIFSETGASKKPTARR